VQFSRGKGFLAEKYFAKSLLCVKGRCLRVFSNFAAVVLICELRLEKDFLTSHFVNLT